MNNIVVKIELNAMYSVVSAKLSEIKKKSEVEREDQ